MTETTDIATQEDLTAMLKTGVVAVQFVKADGSLRDMNATTNMTTVEAMAPNKVPDPTRPKRAPVPGLFVVFDVDVKDWRSFKYDNLVYTG